MAAFINKSKLAAGGPSTGSGIGATAQSMIETGAPFAGALFGGTIGAASGLLTAGTTSIPGAMVGAALGTFAGNQIAEITRPFLTGEQTPLEEQIRRGIRMGIFEGVSEGAVPAGGQALSLALWQ